MSTITFNAGAKIASRTRAATAVATPLRKRPGLFVRLVKAMVDARERQVADELRRHGLRLPRELEEAGLKLSARNEDSLPFMR